VPNATAGLNRLRPSLARRPNFQHGHTHAKVRSAGIFSMGR
jgi:hypothetical protein